MSLVRYNDERRWLWVSGLGPVAVVVAGVLGGSVDPVGDDLVAGAAQPPRAVLSANFDAGTATAMADDARQVYGIDAASDKRLVGMSPGGDLYVELGEPGAKVFRFVGG